MGHNFSTGEILSSEIDMDVVSRPIKLVDDARSLQPIDRAL